MSLCVVSRSFMPKLLAPSALAISLMRGAMSESFQTSGASTIGTPAPRNCCIASGGPERVSPMTSVGFNSSTLSALMSWPLLTFGIAVSAASVVVASRPIILSANPSEMTISAIASLSTMMRDESVIVTSTSSAEITVAGRDDLPSPIIGSSKSSAEIMTGRVDSFAGSVAGVDVDAVACDVVSVVAGFALQEEINAMKSGVVNKARDTFLVTIAISIY